MTPSRFWIAVCLWLGLAAFASSAEAARLATINGAQLEAMQADGRPLVIVDVREPELFAQGHITGAINIPYDDARPRMLKELSPKDRIVFVCHSGPMGDKLGHVLVNKGFPTVFNLAGGMKQWKGPVVR
ncbi:MAG TPA: rhodanese-like domain-containing protein [Nitrospiria bacterium]|nr:rhodanese-like domain-containing protein [Nitrospiria bacterium]